MEYPQDRERNLGGGDGGGGHIKFTPLPLLKSQVSLKSQTRVDKGDVVHEIDPCYP